MKRYLLTLACLLIAPPTWAQINLNSLLDAGKNIAQGISATDMSEADEIAIGNDIAARTMGAYRLIRDETLQRKLNRIGLWVALQSTRPALPWRFAAVETDTVNAFAAPGGFIMVTRGMLDLVSNEAELACVLGHEIGHVSRKHHLAVLQKALITQGVIGAATAAGTRGSDSDLKQFLVSQGKELTQKFVTLSLDRSAESEADSDGVLLAAKAGYDPAACLSFMKHMAADKNTEMLADLSSTHPAPATRVTDIESDLGRLQGATAGQGALPPLTLKLPKEHKGQGS